MRRMIPAAAVSALAAMILALGSGRVQAASVSTDPNHPTPLTASAGGTVAAAGFDYYSFAYAGGGASAQITLTYGPTDASRDPQLGFNVYASDGTLVGQGSQSGLPLGTKYLQFSSSQGGVYLLQIFDYATAPIAFQVATQGITAPGAAPAPVPSKPAPDPTLVAPTPLPVAGSVKSSASAPLPLTRAQNVSLIGNTGGSFDYYALHSASGGTVNLTLSVSPDVDIFNGTAGFRVYQGSAVVASSSISGTTPWTGNASFKASGNTDYLVQIFNYDGARTITYSLATS